MILRNKNVIFVRYQKFNFEYYTSMENFESEKKNMYVNIKRII